MSRMYFNLMKREIPVPLPVPNIQHSRHAQIQAKYRHHRLEMCPNYCFRALIHVPRAFCCLKEGVVNGPSKNACLAKIKPNSRGRVVPFFYGGPSWSLDFFFNAKEVSGSQKMYQSRRLAKSRIYHSTPLKEARRYRYVKGGPFR